MYEKVYGYDSVDNFGWLLTLIICEQVQVRRVNYYAVHDLHVYQPKQ